MAIKKTNNKKQNKKADTRGGGKNILKGDDLGTLDVVSGIGRMELTMFSFGLILVVLALFMFVSFCSFLTTGSADYDLLENAADITNEAQQYKNVCGSIGANMAYFFLNRCFGLASFIIPPYLIILGFRMMKIYRVTLVRKFILMVIILIWSSVCLAFVDSFLPTRESGFLQLGGYHGDNVVDFLSRLLGAPGVIAILAVTGVFFLIYVSVKTVEHIRALFRLKFIDKIRNLRNVGDDEDLNNNDNLNLNDNPNPNDNLGDDGKVGVGEDEKGRGGEQNEPATNDDAENEAVVAPTGDSNAVTFDFTNIDKVEADKEKGAEAGKADDLAALFDEAYVLNHGKNDVTEKKTDNQADNADYKHELDIEMHETEEGDGNIERGAIETPYDPKLNLEQYKYPTLDLIRIDENEQQVIDPDEQNANKDRIIQVLHNFGVEISSIKATIGPTITLYEIVPAEGVRITKIRNLEDDIALSLAAEGIRIIAPIPGKGTIGIEVPNKKKCIVSMESVLNSKVYQESTMELPCAVGKTITNEVFMFDLAKAPHLLVAGATGQGKSVGLNAIIASLLYKKHPAELKIVMVDPKKVEFSIYTPIENHFLARLEEEEECIITDVQKVVKTLNSLCQLMDTRYDLLKMAGCRNIKEYNAKFKARQLNPEHGHEFMPYIVVVVDEFGDLIMTAGKEVELPICRIAQLARAVGIHMIIATQRPQASIISGAIKTNFPARMAFKVSSMVDSRVVLDRPGAQQLIGRGDMLFLTGSDPVRVQCAFLDTPEVSNICQFIAKQQAYLHPMFLPDVIVESGDGGGAGAGMDTKHLDPLFADVAKFVVNNQMGSTSMIQRNYSIGYNRAGKIMDQLEKMGVVGSQIGSKPREVLIKDPLTLEGLLNTLG